MNLKLTKTQKVCRTHGLWPLEKSIKQNDKKTTLTNSQPRKVFLQERYSWKQLFCNVTRWGYGQNARKVHVKELVFGKVAGSEPWNFTKN